MYYVAGSTDGLVQLLSYVAFLGLHEGDRLVVFGS